MSTPARILMVEGDTVPSAPTAGQVLLYAKTNNTFYSLNSLGVETPLGGGSSVTSVAGAGSQGVTVSGSPITGSGTLTIGLGAITPTSVAASGTVTGSNLSGSSSGTNTGDQTITLTGDVTGSGTGSFATALSTTGVSAATYGSSTQVPVFTVDAKGRITGVTNTTITAGSGTVTTVSVTTANGVSGSVATATTTPAITLTLGAITPSSVAATTTVSGTTITASVGFSGPGSSITALNASNLSSGTVGTARLGTGTANGTTFLRGDGTWATPSGTGTVTTVSVTTANGVSGSVANATSTPAITLTLGAITPSSVAAVGTVTGSNLSGTNTGDQTITLTGDVTGSGTGSFAATLSTTGVVANTYGSATQVPVFTVDSKGRISSVTNTTITGGGSSEPEIVVFKYSSGGSGNFTPVDAIFSQTAGVTTTITDGANCIASYAFTGKSNPPKSITTYGQNFTTNVFAIKDTSSLPTASIVGGGTAASPDLGNGLFSAANIVSLQTRMSDTAAASTIGNRAWLLVVFGF